MKIIIFAIILGILFGIWLESIGIIVDGMTGKEFWFEEKWRLWVHYNICFWRR